jgi:hypothetical protein
MATRPCRPFARTCPGGDDGEVDWDAHAALIDRSVEQGVQVLTANGDTGEYYALDVPSRLLRLKITDDELDSRRSEWRAPGPRYERGYGALYQEHITQADEGCDFDFLARPGRNPGPDPS